MGVKSWKVVNILIWGGVGLIVAGIALSYPAFSPYLSALLSTPGVPETIVIVTPTPEPVVALLPFEGEMPTPPPDGSGADQPPMPTATATSLFPLDADEDAVFTYTLPVATGAVPSRIRIPAIDLEAPIVPIGWKNVDVNGVTQPIWDVPAWRAAGWHETSAPIGIPGNTVLNGHNTSNGEVFRYLYKLDVGALVFIEADDGETYAYTVTEKLILREAGQPIEVRVKNAQYIQPTADERLTLVTCHPYGSLAKRLLIIARPASKPSTGSLGGE